MITLKLIQNLIKVFNSQGTPRQIGFGFAIGAFLGLLPFNLIWMLFFFLNLMLFNVAFSAGLLGMAIYKILSFGLDPVSDFLGTYALITYKPLTPFWTWLYNVPGVPLTSFNNTITLGCLILGTLLFIPNVWGLVLFTRFYRKTLKAKISQFRVIQVLKATRLGQFSYRVWEFFS